MREFKRFHGIADNVRDRAAINAAIRKNMPGGSEILDVIERLIRMQHGREMPDPALQDMLDKMASAREKMAGALLAGFAAQQAAVPAEKKAGPPLMEDRIDYSGIDWSKSDAQLAREFGVTRQNIAARRKRYAPQK
ncbi:MAG: hypothetical protein LBB60_02830 [Desulfovibrio sp.]|nr:hypothetical protein [Desulfovibrio sp.]